MTQKALNAQQAQRVLRARDASNAPRHFEMVNDLETSTLPEVVPLFQMLGALGSSLQRSTLCASCVFSAFCDPAVCRRDGAHVLWRDDARVLWRDGARVLWRDDA